MRRLTAALVTGLALALASPAYGQTADPEKLFAEGTSLMEQGKYDEALPKLQNAQKIDPGIGTLFNIAVCQQKLGRLGSAYRGYRDVMKLAGASGKKAREEAARAKLDEVKSAAPAFAIVSAEKADVTVRVDGESIAKDDWTYYPVDPGSHRVDAVAPEKKPWSTTLAAPAGGTTQRISIPVLEVAKQTVTVTKETTNSRRTLGFIFGGVGVAGVITATVTGIMLLGDNSTAEEKCPFNPALDKKSCARPDGTVDQDGADAVNRGKTLLPINAIAWGVAAVGLGAGAFFLFTSGKKSEPAKTAFVPQIDATSAGGSLVGRF
jgi:hypothetical protein